MPISSEKSKIMTTGISDHNIGTHIDINGKQLQLVQQLKYLGGTISKMCNSETEIKARIGATTSALIQARQYLEIKKHNNREYSRINEGDCSNNCTLCLQDLETKCKPRKR